MRRPEGVVCMHRTCRAAALKILKAKITELPRAEASARVAATKMLLCCCYIMYASCPITALDAFFYKRTSDATPSPPHPHPPSRTARPSTGPTHPPRFS